ncbi:MAG: S24 family peptidase [Alphaproteobacteria bacterium]|nr:S24 family peptidase [Alphaproteobacteria bacterium]
MNIDQIRKHIDSLIKEKGKNYRSLSMAIGKNEAYLHQYINKGSPLRLPEEERRKLAALLDVEEQELTDIALPKTISPTTGHSKTSLIEIISSNPAQASSGFLSLPLSDYSNITSASSDHIKMLRVNGDSMVPTLKDGDYVLTDITSPLFSSDGLYVIRLASALTVRRIQQINSSEFLIIPDNSNYKGITIASKKLEIVGKVICLLKTEKVA